MKTLFLVSLLALAFQASPISISSSAHQQIKDEVAEYYDVNSTDVTLQSPNLVYVDLGTATTTGTASFWDCGVDCTRIAINFGTDQLEFIVEEEVDGL